MPPFPSTNGSYNGASHLPDPSVSSQLNGPPPNQQGKTHHDQHGLSYRAAPLACMPIRTVVPLVISRAHCVVVRPPTSAPTNMTPIIVACMYLQCSSSLKDIRADVAE